MIRVDPYHALNLRLARFPQIPLLLLNSSALNCKLSKFAVNLLSINLLAYLCFLLRLALEPRLIPHDLECYVLMSFMVVSFDDLTE